MLIKMTKTREPACGSRKFIKTKDDITWITQKKKVDGK